MNPIYLLILSWNSGTSRSALSNTPYKIKAYKLKYTIPNTETMSSKQGNKLGAVKHFKIYSVNSLLRMHRGVLKYLTC